VTTIITTPVVELIYPVKKMMTNKLTTGGGSILSILLCVSNAHTARKMVSMMQPIVRPRAPFSTLITAFHAVHAVDEPVGYIGSWLYEKKKFFSAPLRAARRQAQQLGLKIDCVAFIGEDGVEKEVQQIAIERDVNLIVIGISASSDRAYRYVHT
jgi:nucleotide-binding universal stress UspA family protein